MRLVKKILISYWEKWVADDSNVLDRSGLALISEPIEYGDPEIFEIDPVNYQFVPEDFQMACPWVREYTEPRMMDKPVYFELEKVELLGKRALAVASTRQVILESCGGLRGYLLKSGDFKQVLFPFLFRTIKVKFAVSLVDSLSRNYYHWVNDMLPLLEAVNHYKLRTGRVPIIFIDRNPPQFQIDFLVWLGFGECFQEWHYNRACLDKTLIINRRYSNALNDKYWARAIYLSKNSYQWLRSQLMTGVERNNSYDRVYIARKEAHGRSVINEAEFMSKFASWGFRKVYLEDMTIQNQLGLFKCAKVVLAVHGAGLTNLAFSEQVKVIELFPDSRNTYYTSNFYQISCFFGHEHFLVSCDTVDQAENIRVNATVLIKLVEEIVDSR